MFCLICFKLFVRDFFLGFWCLALSSCLTFTPRPSPRPAEKEEMSEEDVTRRDEERGDAEEEEAEAIDGEEESDADASDSEEMDVEKPTIVPGSSK